MIRAIIFDCFGVLLEDSLKALTEKLAAGRRAEVLDVLHASHRGLLTPEESTRQVTALLDMTPAAYRHWVEAGEVKNQPLLDYIAELHKDYKTAILSNISTGGLTRRFSAAELRLFDVVVASGEEGYAKPEARIYEIAAERLGVRLDECVFTDDREEYVEAARGVGMQALVYTNLTQFKTDLEKLLRANTQ